MKKKNVILGRIIAGDPGARAHYGAAPKQPWILTARDPRPQRVPIVILCPRSLRQQPHRKNQGQRSNHRPLHYSDSPTIPAGQKRRSMVNAIVNALTTAVEGGGPATARIPDACANLATTYPQATGRYPRDGLFRRRSSCAARPEALLDVVDDDLLKVGGDRRTTQCHGLLAVDKNRSGRLLAGAG